MRLRQIFSLGIFSLAATSALTAWALIQTPPSAPKALLVPLEQEVNQSVVAKGFIGLSEPLSNLDASPKRVRVLAFNVTFFSGGMDVVQAFGVPTIPVDGNEPYQYKGGGVGRGTLPSADTDKYPRSYGMVIRPKNNRTWGTVSAPDDLEITFQWESQPPKP